MNKGFIASIFLLFATFTSHAVKHEGEYSPVISPNGQFVAYHKHNADMYWDIVIKDLQTGEIRQISQTSTMEVEPSWSPDGNQLVYASRVNDDWDIYLYDIKEKEHRALIVNPGMDNAPKWSPNANIIAFVSTRSGSAQLHQLNLDTHEIKQLTHEERAVSHPSWSLDGRQIIFDQYFNSSQVDKPGRSAIYQLTLNTQKVTLLYGNNASSISGFKSHDHLFITTNRSGNWDIVDVNLSTGEETPIANEPTNEMKASFHTEMRRIAYSRFNENGVSEVVIKSLK